MGSERLDKRKRLGLRSRGQLIRPSVIVGKEGLSDKVIHELERQLKKTKLVKVKLLSSPEEGVRAFAERMSAASHAELIETRGKTVLLYREH